MPDSAVDWNAWEYHSDHLVHGVRVSMVGQPGQGNRPQDTPLAAIALQLELTRVTHPTDAFSRLAGLRVEDATVGYRQKRASRRDEKGAAAPAVFLAQVSHFRRLHILQSRGQAARLMAQVGHTFAPWSRQVGTGDLGAADARGWLLG